MWDCCKDLCNYEVNVDLTLTTEQESENICPSLELLNEEQEVTALENPHQEKLKICKKTREILPLI